MRSNLLFSSRIILREKGAFGLFIHVTLEIELAADSPGSNGGPRVDRGEPSAQIHELLKPPLTKYEVCPIDPAPSRDVGDCVFAGHDEISAGELLVKYSIVPLSLA